MTPFFTLAWWLSPLSDASDHHLPSGLIWHARLMVLAWGVLLPLGALAARYFKIVPGQDWPRVLDNKTWWHAHRGFQYLGVGLMVVGTWLAWGHGGQDDLATPIALWHSWMGWALLLAAGLQLVSAWTRGSKGGPTAPTLRGDHYDMTPHRLWFERIHKGLGWTSIAIAWITIVLGLVAADAPRWMPGLLLAWWLALGVLAARWQRQGRCIDTYQAIWGPDPSHPGNLIPAQGWGAHRPTAPSRADTPSI